MYHISTLDLGNNVILKPKIPESASYKTEGNIPRICVSPNISLCVKSLIGCNNPRVYDVLALFVDKETILDTDVGIDDAIFLSPTVYQTQQIPYLPPNAVDFRKYNEHWFLSETKFIRIGYLDLKPLIKGEITIVQSNVVYTIDDFIDSADFLDRCKYLETYFKIRKNVRIQFK